MCNTLALHGRYVIFSPAAGKNSSTRRVGETCERIFSLNGKSYRFGVCSSELYGKFPCEFVYNTYVFGWERVFLCGYCSRCAVRTLSLAPSLYVLGCNSRLVTDIDLPPVYS